MEDPTPTPTPPLTVPGEQEPVLSDVPTATTAAAPAGAAALMYKGRPQLHDLDNLDVFLEQEKQKNRKEPWCKLNKTVRSMKMREFADEYQKQHQLGDDEKEIMIQFLRDCLDRKKLQRVKDVVYDREREAIKDIPALTYVRNTRHFTLRNLDNKRVSTLKSLAKSSLKHSARANLSSSSRQSTADNRSSADEEDEA